MTLVVNDGTDDSNPDEVIITVQDTTPPEIELNLLIDTLWPPNNKLVKVADISTLDLDGAEVGLLVEVTSNESITQCDWVWKDDTGELYLRAARDGRGDGRVYTITVAAVDGSGNMATEEAVVTVPHDQGKGGKKDEGDHKGGKKDKDNDHDNNNDKKDRGGNRSGKRK